MTDSLCTPERDGTPPRLSAQTTRKVKQVWHGLLRPLDGDSLAEVVDVLRPGVDHLLAPTDVDIAIAQVHFMRFVRDTGKTSFGAHRSWYSKQPDKEDLYSTQTLRTKFGGSAGSWDEVKQLLGAAARKDVTVNRLLKNTVAGRREVMLEAARVYAREVEALPRIEPFIAWCSEQLDSPAPMVFGPLPRTASQLYRAFGTFADLLDAAGLPEAAQAARERALTARGSDEEWLELVRLASRELANPELTSPAYDHWRGEYCARLGLELASVPSGEVLKRRFGGWPALLYRAGLISLEAFALRLAGLLRPGREVALATLAAAICEHGEQVTDRQLTRWRKRVVAEAATAGDLLLVQTPETLVRLAGDGNWSRARANARAWMDAGGAPQAGVIRNDLVGGNQ